MELSIKGLNLIKFWEQLRLKAYLDTGGVPTIGWGTTVYPDGKRVKMGDTCIAEQADEYLTHDVRATVKAVNFGVKIGISQEMFDALVVFAYNVGSGAFAASTLLKLLNQSKFELAAQQFPFWKYDNRIVQPGLVRRRASEQKLFIEGISTLQNQPSAPASNPENVTVLTTPQIISVKQKKK